MKIITEDEVPHLLLMDVTLLFGYFSAMYKVTLCTVIIEVMM